MKVHIDSHGYKLVVADKIPDGYVFPLSIPSLSATYVIPVDFSSHILMDKLFIGFKIRRGFRGPEYQILFPDDRTILVDWSEDIDSTWMLALQKIESSIDAKGIDESVLDGLDTNPFDIFGVTHHSTQRLIEEQHFEECVLISSDIVPSLADWFAYLRADKDVESSISWVVESFRDSCLPHPWATLKSDKGWIMFRNGDSGEITSKHPFYDYFHELLEFCRDSSYEEQLKLRVSRLIWLRGGRNGCIKDPLVTPDSIKAVANIFRVDVVSETALVPVLKFFLKLMHRQYNTDEGIDISDISQLCNRIDSERRSARSSILCESFSITVSDKGFVFCSNCSLVATGHCPQCGDSLCTDCSETIHARGRRSEHIVKKFIVCSVCKSLPSMSQCSYTYGFYCKVCYLNHAKSLPRYLDLKSIDVDYGEQKTSRVRGNIERDGTWHPFSDIRGVVYYYNFGTDESMRRTRIGMRDDGYNVLTEEIESLTHPHRQRILTRYP